MRQNASLCGNGLRVSGRVDYFGFIVHHRDCSFCQSVAHLLYLLTSGDDACDIDTLTAFLEESDNENQENERKENSEYQYDFMADH